jgi:hypothetical protein
MKGVKLNLEQAQELHSKKFDDNQWYNPVVDNNDEYFISEEEVNQTTNPETLWVKNLPLVDIEIKKLILPL